MIEVGPNLKEVLEVIAVALAVAVVFSRIFS